MLPTEGKPTKCAECRRAPKARPSANSWTGWLCPAFGSAKENVFDKSLGEKGGREGKGEEKRREGKRGKSELAPLSAGRGRRDPSEDSPPGHQPDGEAALRLECVVGRGPHCGAKPQIRPSLPGAMPSASVRKPSPAWKTLRSCA